MFRKNTIWRQMHHRKLPQHPYLKSITPCSSITTHERYLTFLAMNINRGDLTNVNREWSYILENSKQYESDKIYKMIREGFEIVLQTHLFSGFPRVINALAVIHELNRNQENTMKDIIDTIHKEESVHVEQFEKQTLEQCKQYGLQNYQIVYGALANRVTDKMNMLHPFLNTWTLTHGYGTVLQRQDKCNFRLRELCAVSTLCSGSDVSPQLGSHLRGALKVGCTREELESIISQAHLLYGEDAQNVATATLFSLDRSRSSL
jgi:alkylhydroperoxidase/carboxymuconolactone decarboxylase family protein YurZ